MGICGTEIHKKVSTQRDLGFWHCHELWCRSQMQLGSPVAVAVAVAKASSCSLESTPSLGTSICHRCIPKKKKKKKSNPALQEENPILRIKIQINVIT